MPLRLFHIVLVSALLLWEDNMIKARQLIKKKEVGEKSSWEPPCHSQARAESNDTRPGCGLLKLKVRPQWHPSSNKVLVLPKWTTSWEPFKCMNLSEFLSFKLPGTLINKIKILPPCSREFHVRTWLVCPGTWIQSLAFMSLHKVLKFIIHRHASILIHTIPIYFLLSLPNFPSFYCLSHDWWCIRKLLACFHGIFRFC